MRAVFFAATTFLLIGGALVLTAVYQLVNADKPVEGVQVASSQPVSPVFNMSFADTTKDIDLSIDLDLRGLLPEAPEGWFRKDYVIADGEKLTGSEVIRSAVRKSDSNSMILKFETDAKNTAGHTAYTYMRGDRLILVRARVLEFPNSVASSSAATELLGQDATQIHSLLRPRDQLDRADLRFVFKDGVVVYQRPPFGANVRSQTRALLKYRTFRAAIGRVEFEIASNASDAAVANLIQEMDLTPLHAQLGIHQPSGFTVLAAEPLSNQPPPDRSAYAAASAILSAETNLSRTERVLLEGIAEGRFLTRARIARELDGAEMPITIARFLQNHQLMKAVSENPAFMERQAAALVHHLPRANLRSFMALHLISIGEITDIADYRRLLGDPSELHPKVKDLLLVHGVQEQPASTDQRNATQANLSFGGEGSSSASEVQQNRPTVRRGLVARTGQTGGGSCTIEKGVRRCVVGVN